VCLIWCETVVSVTSFVLAGIKMYFRGDLDFENNVHSLYYSNKKENNGNFDLVQLGGKFNYTEFSNTSVHP